VIRKLAKLISITAALGLGCSEDRGASAADTAACFGAYELSFTPEVPRSGTEGYSCFAFPAPRRGPLRALRWAAPELGVELHHASLYATREARATGRFDCNPMPADAFALHVWVPGGTELELPMDVGLDLPDTTATLIVEVHAYRSGPEPAAEASVTLCHAESTPDKLADRVGLIAPVPALRPQTIETSTSRCRLRDPWNLLFAWPHLHRKGQQFHGTLLRGKERLPIVDVNPWDFTHQITYPLALYAEAGDVIETTCVWENDSDEYVLPGIYTENEMCTHGLVGWPAEGGWCDYE
jgi:hypothetical protein